MSAFYSYCAWVVEDEGEEEQEEQEEEEQQQQHLHWLVTRKS